MRANVSRSLVVVLVAASAPSAHASDIHVPAEYSTIQAAIDAAVDGDSVLVAPGTYFENIDFKGRAIAVRAAEGAAATTIDGGGKDHVAKFVSGESNSSVLEGFTIRDGLATGGADDAGGGIWIDGCSPTISRNVIVANVANYGGGIALHLSVAVIVDNIIRGNLANTDGGGIHCASRRSDGQVPLITNNTIASNTAAGGAGGGILIQSSEVLITNSIVEFNVNGAIEVRNASPVITYCDVTGGLSGTGNIDADPLFLDLASGDLRIGSGSPCIDGGSASAPGLPATDADGDARILGAGPEIGADETHPIVESVTPKRSHYAQPAQVMIKGFLFTSGTGLSVSFGAASASNVVVVDDQTIACDVPAGDPGSVDVVVSNSIGTATLASGFAYAPAITIDGVPTLGSTITIHDLCEPGDGIFAVFGLPPAVSIPTPPFDGNLAIVPFHYFFYVAAWPFDSFDVSATIPNDPALAGVDVLLQSLIGPQLTKPPKDGRWTNCAVLSIY